LSAIRTLFLIAEADPFAKVGGLGEVGGALPLALRSLGVDVRLALPYHGAIRQEEQPLHSLVHFMIPYSGGETEVEILELEHQGLPIYFIAGPIIWPDMPVYTRDTHADGLKFTFYSMAALELCHWIDWQPNILHANDWHAAPAVYALQFMRKKQPFFAQTSSLLSVHNLPYLGAGAGRALAAFGLPPAIDSSLPVWAQDVPFALGLRAADRIVAVSPTYAREILTREFSAGLYPLLRRRTDSISGILNGLDDVRWNPQTDTVIAARFGEQNMDPRPLNKLSLQAELGLEQSISTPLMAFVGRVDQQRGVDLLPEALHQLTLSTSAGVQPWQLVILGTGEPHLEEAMRAIEVDFPRRARAVIRYDVELSRRIYAGADILLLPSRYEPCGMSQMIAMRYGCVPLARAVGGLCDTVQDFDQTPDSTGFLFKDEDPESLAQAIRRSWAVYRKRREWKALQLRGMRRDFSWKKTAIQYLDLYQSLTRI
jgi:starch synthase